MYVNCTLAPIVQVVGAAMDWSKLPEVLNSSMYMALPVVEPRAEPPLEMRNATRELAENGEAAAKNKTRAPTTTLEHRPCQVPFPLS